jgi:hypothetical protein
MGLDSKLHLRTGSLLYEKMCISLTIYIILWSSLRWFSSLEGPVIKYRILDREVFDPDPGARN